MQLITDERLLKIAAQAEKLRAKLAPLVVQRNDELKTECRQWRANKQKRVRMVDDLYDADGSFIMMQRADDPPFTEAKKAIWLVAAHDAALRWQGVEPIAPSSWLGDDLPADQLLAAASYRVLLARISKCDPGDIAALQVFVDDLTPNPDVSPFTPTPATDPDEASLALTENQSRVLETMAHFDGSLLLSAKAIAAAMNAPERLSEETVRQCVVKLVEVDLAERPEGPRSGARLINKGRRLAGKIAG